MRHNKKFNHLGRKTAHRKAMLANMASSLIQHKRITTTVAKAKALRMYVEPLITKSKKDSTHSRRVVFSYLQDKEAVSELFREVAGKIADRPGGYTRILKTGNRLGDNAEMCIFELVDFIEAMLAAKEETAAPKKRRSRRGGAKKTEAAAPVTEAPVADEVEVVEDVKPVEETEAKAEEPKAEKTDAADEKKEE
jgi:large subunit ribosomal protein L17